MISTMSAENKSPRAKVLLSRAGVLVFYLLLWSLAAHVIDQPLLLPAPLDVIQRLLQLLPQASSWRSTA